MHLKLFLTPILLGLLVTALNAQTSKDSTDRKVKLSGQIEVYAGLYQASGIEPRNPSSPLGINASATIELPGGVYIPFSATLGNQGASYQQPFNQFGASPTYKWAKVHLGYRNVNFSPFTLGGHTFLGAGVELNPGLLRLGAVVGRFNKAIEQNFANPDVAPAFKRKGYAVKLGIGRPNNYLDLIAFKAKDDENSIQTDSITNLNAQPGENMVLGASSRLLIFKRLTFEGDAGLSGYTQDLRDEAVEYVDKDAAAIFGPLFTARQSTTLTFAGQSAVGYKGKVFGIKLQYKHIEPGYRTMGAYYFQNDLKSYTVAPELNLGKGKVRLHGSYGIQHDNLRKNKGNELARQIGSVLASINPNQTFGLDLQASNYGISQRAGLRPVIDTIRLAQNNFSWMVNTRLNFVGGKTSNLFVFTVNEQRLTDLNSHTENLSENRNFNANLSWFFQHLASGFGVNLSGMFNKTFLPQGQELQFFGPSLGLSKRFGENFNASLQGSYLINQQNNVDGSILNGGAQFSYQLKKNHELAFNEFWGNVGYYFRF
jgi:hypothetical protein